MEEYIRVTPSCEKYRGLNWDRERKAAQGDPDALREVLRTCLQ